MPSATFRGAKPSTEPHGTNIPVSSHTYLSLASSRYHSFQHHPSALWRHHKITFIIKVCFSLHGGFRWFGGHLKEKSFPWGLDKLPFLFIRGGGFGFSVCSFLSIPTLLIKRPHTPIPCSIINLLFSPEKQKTLFLSLFVPYLLISIMGLYSS